MPAPRTTTAAIAAALVTAVITTLSVTTFTIGGGTAIDKVVRTTAAIDVNSVTAQSATTSVVTLTGASVGDHIDIGVIAGDLGGSTSTINVRGMVTAANTVTLVFFNSAATSSQASFNAGASTISLMATSF